MSRRLRQRRNDQDTELLGTFDPQELAAFISSNRELSEKFRPMLERLISGEIKNDVRLAEWIDELALRKLLTYKDCVEDYMKHTSTAGLSDYAKPFLLDMRVARGLGIDHMPHVEGK